jgi:hypothetical protein
VVAADGHDLARRARRRDSVRIALALHDEHRDGDGIQVVEAALTRLARPGGRLERKRKAEDAGCARRLR